MIDVWFNIIFNSYIKLNIENSNWARKSMSNEKWKEPFKQLKDKLQVLYDANLNIYHGVLMAPFHAANEVEHVVHKLEASYAGKNLLARINTPTEGCQHHAHYFFGNNSCFQQLGRNLSGIKGWMEKVPEELVPKFHIPKLENQVEENLVRWANLVYFLAWELDAPNLEATVEYQEIANGGSSFLWEECPQPSNCDPRPWLIHQADRTDQIQEWMNKFSNEDLSLPEIIDAYLLGESMIGEFISRSLTAIDGLIFILEHVKQRQSEPSAKFSKPIREKWPKSVEVSNEVEFLKKFLVEYHSKERLAGNIFCPLTANEIAIQMKWISKSGKPLQSKVNRRMAQIFGENPMQKYKSPLEGEGIDHHGFQDRTEDGLKKADAYYYDPEPDFD